MSNLTSSSTSFGTGPHFPRVDTGTPIDNPAEGPYELNACLRDLVALTALPALWVGQPMDRVAEGLADAVLRILGADYVCVRLEDEPGKPIEIIRTARPNRSVAVIADTLLTAPLNHDGTAGSIVVGCNRPGFPNGAERLLFNVAANQAAIALAGARTSAALARKERELSDYVESASIPMHRVGPDGVILWANSAEMEMLGYRPEEYLGHQIAEFHVDPETIRGILERLSRGESLRDWPARLRCKDGSIKQVLIDSSVRWEDERFIHTRCFTRDVTAQKVAERRLETQYIVASTLAEAGRLHDASGTILRSIGEMLGVDLGILWSVDHERGVLRCTDVWHRTGDGLAGFADASRARTFPRGVGLPGRIWASGEMGWIADLAAEGGFLRAPDACEAGISSQFGFPVRAGNDILGVMEFFSRTTIVADDSVRSMMEAAAGQIGQFIRRRRAEIEVNGLLEREEAARREAEEQLELHVQLNTALRAAAEARDHALSEMKSAQERLTLLSEASARLAGSLDYETTLRTVARLAVGGLADWCAVDVLDETGTLHRLATEHEDPKQIELVSEIQRRYPSDPDSPHGPQAVVRKGEPEFYPDIPDALLVSSARDGQHLALLRQINLGSAIVIPMTVQGRTLGALSLAWARSCPSYSEADVSVAEGLAHRAALAIENARLYRRAESSREQLALALNAAQEALRSRDEFLSAASHDLKNPLTSIKAGTQILQRLVSRPGPLDSERLKAGLKGLDTAATRIARQVDDLQDASCLQTGQLLALQRSPTDLVTLARQAVDEHDRTAGAHRFWLEHDESELVGQWDRVRLERVLDNLLGNAVKYSPGGGDVVLSLRGEHDGAGSWAVLSVHDDGIGIPPDEVGAIFDSYRRGSNVPTLISGSGIGLASVRQIVEQHGGTVSAESVGGKGSTFTVRLPLTSGV